MTDEEIKSWKETLIKAGWEEKNTDLGILWYHLDTIIAYTFSAAIREHKEGNKNLEYARSLK